MLEFKKLSFEDREKIKYYLELDGKIMSDRSFQSLYIWQNLSNVRFCIKDDFLYVKGQWDDKALYYSMPMGKGSLETAISNIVEDAKKRGGYPHIYTITPERLDEVKALLGDEYNFVPNRSFFDYVYSAEELINLKGKKYHSKRNFINRFLKEYENEWEYKELVSADKDEIIAFFNAWVNENSNDKSEFDSEYGALKMALDNFDALGMMGGKLYVKGKLVAFTVASAQNNEALEIHFEKSMGVVGGYQMISNQFLKHNAARYKYINREEDMGIEGLRKSKLSLNPLFLSEKYVATHD